VTTYIQEVSFTPQVGRISVSCRLAESDSQLRCIVKPLCLDNVVLTIASYDIPQNFETDQPCNVTIQAISLGGVGIVVEERLFISVTPLPPPIIPTIVSTTVTVVTPTKCKFCVNVHLILLSISYAHK